MNINELQKKINDIDNKLQLLKLDTGYDGNNNYMMKYNGKNIIVNLIDNIDDKVPSLNSNHDVINIYINDERIEDSDVICESDLNELLFYKDICEEKLFLLIRDYILFYKYNSDFFEILNLIMTLKKTKVSVMEESSSTNEVSPRNVVGILNNEFEKKYNFVQKRKYFISNDKKLAVFAMHSKKYDRPSYKYWYTFHSYQKEVLDGYDKSFILFFFDDKNEYILMDTEKLYPHLEKLGKTKHGDSIGWHIHIQEQNGDYQIRLPRRGLLDIKDSVNNISEKNREEIIIDISSDEFKVIRY